MDLSSRAIAKHQQLEIVLPKKRSGTALAKSRDELRKRRKGRNDQGNGGCADCFGPSILLEGSF